MIDDLPVEGYVDEPMSRAGFDVNVTTCLVPLRSFIVDETAALSGVLHLFLGPSCVERSESSMDIVADLFENRTSIEIVCSFTPMTHPIQPNGLFALKRR